MQNSKCDKEAENGNLHMHKNKCSMCEFYSECEYIRKLKKHYEKKGLEKWLEKWYTDWRNE